jgi:hypothetical protein
MRILSSLITGSLCALLLAAGGCKHDQDAELQTACSGIGATTPDKIIMQLGIWQSAASAPFRTYLTQRTEKFYPCANYQLPYTLSINDRTIAMEFSEPVAPGICLTSPGRAGSSFDVENLASGSYDLQLRVGKRSTTGTLLVLPDRFEFSTCDTNLVAMRNAIMRRIPANLIWGRSVAANATPAGSAIVRSMRDSLIRLGAQPLVLPTGYYGQLEIDASGALVVSRLGYWPTAVIEGFTLTYAGPSSRIKAYLNRHRDPDVSTYIRSDKGEVMQ